VAKEPWYESDSPGRFARGGMWRMALIIIAIVVFFGLLTAGIWWIRVVTAPVKGAGDQEIIINDGRNRINAQEWFEGQYAQILAADQKLDQAKADLDANPGDDFYRTNYTGLKNRCIDMVNAYDAEANKVSRGEWRDPALPNKINQSDSKTDCKEKTAQ
jgi:hypothetical protein